MPNYLTGWDDMDSAKRYGDTLSIEEACDVIDLKLALWQQIRMWRWEGGNVHTLHILEVAKRILYYEVALTQFAEKHMKIMTLRELQKDSEEFLLPVRVGVQA
jgi:hypothetical protein